MLSDAVEPYRKRAIEAEAKYAALLAEIPKVRGEAETRLADAKLIASYVVGLHAGWSRELYEAARRIYDSDRVLADSKQADPSKRGKP